MRERPLAGLARLARTSDHLAVFQHFGARRQSSNRELVTEWNGVEHGDGAALAAHLHLDPGLCVERREARRDVGGFVQYDDSLHGEIRPTVPVGHEVYRTRPQARSTTACAGRSHLALAGTRGPDGQSAIGHASGRRHRGLGSSRSGRNPAPVLTPSSLHRADRKWASHAVERPLRTECRRIRSCPPETVARHDPGGRRSSARVDCRPVTGRHSRGSGAPPIDFRPRRRPRRSATFTPGKAAR